MPVKLGTLHREARAKLAEAGIAEAALDARLIVEHFTATSRTDAIASPDREIAEAAGLAVKKAIARRLAGEPVHRILGFREFYGLKLALSPETLEPRPDTETLVDALVPFVRAAAERDGECRILDLGTGTGAIALALLATIDSTMADGVDISDGALATAAGNAAKLGFSGRFRAIKSDWFAEISGRYHVIVSNPPYIPANNIAGLQAEVRNFDPHRALDGGPDGLGAYRSIAKGAKTHLLDEGVVAVEIGSTQKRDVSAVFEEAGFALIQAAGDLGGNDRALIFATQNRS
jgi:release factor glutamine methyltransferase